jgi:hypothetical protein
VAGWQAQGNQAVEEVNTQLNRQVIQESLLRFGLRPRGEKWRAACLPSGHWVVGSGDGSRMCSLCRDLAKRPGCFVRLVGTGVSAIQFYVSFGDVDHIVKGLMVALSV